MLMGMICLAEVMTLILTNGHDSAGRYRIACSPHSNLPHWCFELHYPNAHG